MKALKSLLTNKYSTCIIKVCGLKVLSNQDQFQRIQKWHYVYLKLEDQSYTSQIPPLVDSKFTFCKNVLCFNFFIVDKKLHKTLFSILHWYIRKLMSIGTLRGKRYISFHATCKLGKILEKYFRDVGRSFFKTIDKEYSSFRISFSIAKI